ncbi:MAG: thioredoxin family protein [Bryobacterales bacterium]|nr:thioredoxin family protein [Bryobacterales bacterium]
MQFLSSRSLVALALGVLLATSAFAAATVGQTAPDFTVTDMDGKTHKLSDFQGKYVVLEWLNYGCPFVGKHYNSGNMQALQKEWTSKGVVWLSVISSREGQQGYSTPEKAKTDYKAKNSAATTVILDSKGTLGKAYGAATTPHMYVIGPNGNLLYNGGIDDKATTEVADVKTSKNYVSAALTEAMAGKPVTMAKSQPYGCNVKY